ncbi:MAG: hypothetical protein QFX40_06330 [Archaeoglobales archaeon]|nr:hypothetical protein [Archaeoglobales archaeon]
MVVFFRKNRWKSKKDLVKGKLLPQPSIASGKLNLEGNSVHDAKYGFSSEIY